MMDAVYRQYGFPWAHFQRAEYLPPQGDGWARWLVRVGPVEVRRIARAPWDYWQVLLFVPWQVLHERYGYLAYWHSWHFGRGWRNHLAEMKRRYP
jgi:hypothetical protein